MVDLNQSSPDTNIRDLLQTLWKGKFIIVGLVLLATAVAFAQYYVAVPVYKAQAIIMVKSPDKDKLIKENGGVIPEFTLPTSVELIKSYPLALATVQMLLNNGQQNNLELFSGRNANSKSKSGSTDIQAPDAKKMRLYAETLQHRINAENIRSTNLIEVSVSSPYPYEAALLANTICYAFRDKNAEWSATQDISVSRTIEQQITQQEQIVKETATALSDFMNTHEVYESTGNVSDLERAYAAATTEYDSNRVQYEILRKQLAFIEEKLSAEEKLFGKNLFQNIGNQLRSMRENIRSKENAYIALALQKGRNDTEVEAAHNELINLKAQFDQFTRKKIAGEIANSGNAQKYRYDMLASKMQVSIRLAELDNSAREYLRLKNHYQGKLRLLPAKQVLFAKLALDNDVAKKTYAFLKEQLDGARIKVASNVGGIVIIKPALPPAAPESPDLKVNLLAGIGSGLLLGIVGVVLKDKMG